MELLGIINNFYIIAIWRLSTVMKINMHTAGPINPIIVINLLIDKTVHFPLINESAKCPATIWDILINQIILLMEIC